MEKLNKDSVLFIYRYRFSIYKQTLAFVLLGKSLHFPKALHLYSQKRRDSCSFCVVSTYADPHFPPENGRDMVEISFITLSCCSLPTCDMTNISGIIVPLSLISTNTLTKMLNHCFIYKAGTPDHSWLRDGGISIMFDASVLTI